MEINFDLMDLKASVDPEELADYLGLEYQEKSGRFLVLCPFHDDRNLGSAFLQNGRFHCFSCGESMDYISLVMKIKNVGFYKAIRILSGLAGITFNFSELSMEDDGYSRYRLNQEELDVLKFPNSSISLRKIYNASPEQYKAIVLDKTRQQMRHYEDILKNYADRYSEKAYKVCELYNGNISPQVFRDIKDETRRRMRVCQQILERFE